MKKYLLFVLIMLLLQSCAWTYRLNPLVGERYEVRNFNVVVFYEGPSLNSASFHLEKPEWFTIVMPICLEGESSCNMQGLQDSYSGFFKVKFDSGKEAYINYTDFYKHFGGVKNYEMSSPPPAPKDSMICDPIWGREGSFRCRME